MTFQEIIIVDFKKINDPALELLISYLKKKGTRMASNRVLQFILMIVIQLAFGLTKSGVFSLLSSGNAEKIKDYIEHTDEKFPGVITANKRMSLIIEECEN